MAMTDAANDANTRLKLREEYERGFFDGTVSFQSLQRRVSILESLINRVSILERAYIRGETPTDIAGSPDNEVAPTAGEDPVDHAATKAVRRTAIEAASRIALVAEMLSHRRDDDDEIVARVLEQRQRAARDALLDVANEIRLPANSAFHAAVDRELSTHNGVLDAERRDAERFLTRKDACAKAGRKAVRRIFGVRVPYLT